MEFYFLYGHVARHREVAQQHAVVSLAHAIVAASHVFWRECTFPDVECLLALGPLHALALSGIGDAHHFVGSLLSCQAFVVSPYKGPGGLGKGIDTSHPFPATISYAHTLRIGFMHHFHNGAGTGLYACGTWLPAAFILEQSFGDTRIALPCQRDRQGPGVFDGLACALREEWHHGMSRVAKQRDAPGAPLLNRIPVIHCGDKAGLHLIKQCGNRRLGSLE